MTTFTQVPPNIRVPGIYVEVGANGANALLAGQPYRLGVVGQLLSTGTIGADTPTRVTRAEDAQVLFGAGSMLAMMCTAALASARFVELFAIGMADPIGDAAAGGFDFTTTSVRAGELGLYVAGHRISVAVGAGAQDADIATAAAARINALASLPVTASATGSYCALTSKHVGAVGNRVSLEFAAREGELVPTGLVVAVTAMTGGSGTPTIATALAAMGDEQYNVLAFGYEDEPTVSAVTAEMDARADATRQLGGVAITASSGDLAAVKAVAAGQNSERMIVVGAVASPSAPWEWASSVAARVAQDAQEDPARPFTTAPLPGLLTGKVTARPNDLELNDLLYNGVATVVTNASGVAAIQRLITTYQQNDLGADDPSFLDAQSVLILERVRFELRQLGSKFARFKTADDGQAFAPGQEVLTPNGLKAEIVALYASWVERGMTENAADFASTLIVSRDANDPTRLNVEMSPDIVNALRVIAVRVSLTL